MMAIPVQFCSDYYSIQIFILELVRKSNSGAELTSALPCGGDTTLTCSQDKQTSIKQKFTGNSRINVHQEEALGSKCSLGEAYIHNFLILTTIRAVCKLVLTNMSFSSRAAAIRKRSSPKSQVIFAFVFP